MHFILLVLLVGMLCGKQYYNSAKDTLNICDDKDYESIKAEVIKLLRMKYSLEIISEDPLDLKKIEY